MINLFDFICTHQCIFKKDHQQSYDKAKPCTYVQVYWEEAWCMSWSACCGCSMACYAACQRHMMEQYCCGSGSTNKLLCMCFLNWQQANEVILNVWYTRWLLKAQDYSSCIVLHPLHVGCHIMSRTKQLWATVVNSWQSKSRYKCGSWSTCQ